MKSFLKSSYRFFISLKLAVTTLSLLAFFTAIGTFIESRYDQETANKIIYHSWVMGFVLTLLALNLFFVLVDRWPWKKRQIGFVFAHIGILTMILGSIITKYLGLDASLKFKEGESVSFVQLADREIKIYSSYDGAKFTLLYQKDVDFLFQRPRPKEPFVIDVAQEQFFIDQYLPYGNPRESYKKAKKGEPAVRFYLEGQMGNFVDWIQLEKGEKTKTKPMGPASITLTKNRHYKQKHPKELILFVVNSKLFYRDHLSKKKLNRGQTFQTPWMDFKFRLIDFLPTSKREITFHPQKTSSSKTLKAIQVRYKKNVSWIGENSYARFYTSKEVYAFGYVNKTQSLGFDLKLIDFHRTKYQGSPKDKTYESEVEVFGERKLITMNEPLKYKGYTFYQSSFEEDEKGEATISILSVNRDPGRWVKYAGSFLIVLGIALLFLKRKLFQRKK
ncbi:MAG: cytochrome c biogenesis protein ResB [Bdellovibrionales bacterium]